MKETQAGKAKLHFCCLRAPASSLNRALVLQLSGDSIMLYFHRMQLAPLPGLLQSEAQRV